MTPSTEMQSSPLDRAPRPDTAASLVQLGYAQKKQRWVPSRFNARTVGEDGRLIMWNTYSGAVSIFRPEDRPGILEQLSHEGLREPLDRYGRYLSRRGFLVRDDLDEMARFRVRYAREQWRGDVMELILLASEDCNFRCVYCYEKFKNGTMEPQVRQGVREMVLQRAKRLGELNIFWFGGEPLYGWEAVEELSPFFHDIAQKHGMAHHQQMTTNGYLLTEERATRLLEWGCRQYQITVDGLPSEHNCKRVGRDGSETYDVILDNLRSLKARDDRFRVNLRVNFDQNNLLQLGRFLEVLSEDFAGDRRFEMYFRAVGKWGGDNDPNLSTCGKIDEREATTMLRRKAMDVGLHQEGGVESVAPFGSQVCYAARPYNFIVGATGKLMKCTVALDELDENVVGFLHPDGRMEMRDDRMVKWVMPYFETDTACQHCYVLPTCQGSMCPLPRIKYDKRQCCSIKSNLKRDMRFSLTLADHRAAAAAPAEVMAAD